MSKRGEERSAMAWLDRGLFHESLQNFLNSFVNLPVSMVTHLDTEQRWSSLGTSQQSPNLVQFEASLGRLEARRRYHPPVLKQLRRSGRAVVGHFAGAHDAFVPILHEGKAKAALVSGPFFTSTPSAKELQANFRALAGSKQSVPPAALLEYARIAVSTPVLEAPVLKAYLDGLAVAARYLAGSCSGAQASHAFKKLQNEVFGPGHPWRSWRFVESRRDRRFWEFHVQAKLMPWDRVELGLSRHPTIALALCLLRPPAADSSELEELALHAAMQAHCFHLARRFPEAISGRMDQTGAFVLCSPPPKTSPAKVRRLVTDMAQSMAAELRRKFGRPVAVGISRLDSLAEQLPEAMHEAAVALQLGIRVNRELLFFDEQALDAEGSGPGRLLARLGALRDAYSKALREETALAADQFVADVLLQSRLSEGIMRLHFSYAFAALQETLLRRALLPGHRLQQFEQQWLERLEAESTPYGLVAAFRDMLQSFLALITSPGEGDRALRLEQARRYVDQHCLEPISVKSAAAVGGFSASRFSRLFREATGTGFGDYLLQKRLEQAKQLLLRSKLPLQQVAVESGFNSLSYFSQAFKKATGSNPSKFRASHSL